MSLVFFIITFPLLLSLIMAFAWAVATRTGQSGWVDAIWSFAVGATGLIAVLTPIGDKPLATRQLLVATLVSIWSLRLGLHIVGRTVGGAEDPRYASLRQEWGRNFRRRFFWFLQIQAAAAVPLVLTVLVAAHNNAGTLGVGDGLGATILVLAIVGEAVADRQLARFRSDPANKGRICDAGLWGLSRHPNYFCEWLVWLAYTPIAIDPMGDYGWGWLALCAPILMYWLLVHVSGVPPLEAHMLRSRGDTFRVYQARVNAFWPGPPRVAFLEENHRRSK